MLQLSRQCRMLMHRVIWTKTQTPPWISIFLSGNKYSLRFLHLLFADFGMKINSKFFSLLVRSLTPHPPPSLHIKFRWIARGRRTCCCVSDWHDQTTNNFCIVALRQCSFLINVRRNDYKQRAPPEYLPKDELGWEI